jgi:N-acetylmuramoyl-L-alanine amidase
MRQITRIFIHCTASPQSWGRAELLAEFKRKGWKNPGYHYIVLADGRVEQLLAEASVANGVKGYNQSSIHVAYVGGIDSKGHPTDNRTAQQKAALRTLLKDLRSKHPTAQILGHRDIWGTDPTKWQKQCPCFDVREEYGEI